MWTKIFQQSNSRYRAPTLVLFEGQVRSACGAGQAAMGPFYCPTDGRVAPESFTHGSSEQRMRWFKRGLDSGQPKDCNTFTGTP